MTCEQPLTGLCDGIVIVNQQDTQRVKRSRVERLDLLGLRFFQVDSGQCCRVADVCTQGAGRSGGLRRRCGDRFADGQSYRERRTETLPLAGGPDGAGVQ